MLLFVFLLSGSSCATQTLNQDLTTQTFSNNSLQFYQPLAFGFFNALQGANTCLNTELTLQSLTGVDACTNGGSIQTTLLNFSCSETTSLLVQAELEQDFVACREPGENLQGVLSSQLLWDGAQLEVLLTAAGFFYNGLPQSFNDLSVQVLANGEAECSGLLITEGQVCSVTPNCEFCPL